MINPMRAIIRWLAIVLMMVVCSAAMAEQSSHSRLLKNLFRLDHGIKEITFIIYRQDGAPPVVLVRPDGSKIYAARPPDNVQWFDDERFDLITIKEPTPGPWQVVGSVDPRNRMVLLSDLAVSLDQTYEHIFAGEQLQMTARVVTNDTTLDLKPFIERLKMEVWIVRAALDQRFDLEFSGVKLGEYLDRGTGFDKYPNDGVFTSEIEIDAQPGTYQMVFKIYNPTFERQQQMQVTILERPVVTELAIEDGQVVGVRFVCDADQLNCAELVINTELVAMDGRELPIQLTEDAQGRPYLPLDIITLGGEYLLEGVATVPTVDGRNVRLRLKSLQLNVPKREATPGRQVSEVGGEVELAPAVSPLNGLLGEIKRDFNAELTELKALQNKPKPEIPWLWIILINTTVIVLALLWTAFVLMRGKRKQK